ncbi:MAG: transposase, partial [Planctomycetaceae bacterium]|nr:transposase [Planctomycetaceae bacterium]
PAYGWFEKGVEHTILANSGRQRVNINGAVNIDTFEVEVDFTDSINSESMKRLMEQLSRRHPNGVVSMILDNAKYCPSKVVEEYRQDLGAIVFLFLPTYSPNLNLIERLWRFF